jgi:hypothetical protein
MRVPIRIKATLVAVPTFLVLAAPVLTAGWLGTADTYTDFQLKVDFRAGAKINSGIFL